MPCSYSYQFNASIVERPEMIMFFPCEIKEGETFTWKEAKKLQMKYFGNWVPIVRCRHHPTTLNLSCDGKIYESAAVWEMRDESLDTFLATLKKAVRTKEDWANEYSSRRLISLLAQSNRLGELIDIFQEELQHHPLNEAARKMLYEIHKELQRVKEWLEGELASVKHDLEKFRK